MLSHNIDYSISSQQPTSAACPSFTANRRKGMIGRILGQLHLRSACAPDPLARHFENLAELASAGFGVLTAAREPTSPDNVQFRCSFRQHRSCSRSTKGWWHWAYHRPYEGKHGSWPRAGEGLPCALQAGTVQRYGYVLLPLIRSPSTCHAHVRCNGRSLIAYNIHTMHVKRGYQRRSVK